MAFVADNPCIWTDHCHNVPHATDGLVAHLAYAGVGTPFLIGGTAGNEPEQRQGRVGRAVAGEGGEGAPGGPPGTHNEPCSSAPAADRPDGRTDRVGCPHRPRIGC
ncbi:MAG: multicopper oxidase domain-containing protein [Jiangellaceae bacterium]